MTVFTINRKKIKRFENGKVFNKAEFKRCKINGSLLKKLRQKDVKTFAILSFSTCKFLTLASCLATKKNFFSFFIYKKAKSCIFECNC